MLHNISSPNNILSKDTHRLFFIPIGKTYIDRVGECISSYIDVDVKAPQGQKTIEHKEWIWIPKDDTFRKWEQEILIPFRKELTQYEQSIMEYYNNHNISIPKYDFAYVVYPELIKKYEEEVIDADKLIKPSIVSLAPEPETYPELFSEGEFKDFTIIEPENVGEKTISTRYIKKTIRLTVGSQGTCTKEILSQELTTPEEYEKYMIISGQEHQGFEVPKYKIIQTPENYKPIIIIGSVLLVSIIFFFLYKSKKRGK